MLADLARLSASAVRDAPLPCALWAALSLAQGLRVPAQLWLTKLLVDALAARVAGTASPSANVVLWLGLLAATLVGGPLLGGLQTWARTVARERQGPPAQLRVMRRAAALELATFEHPGYYDQASRVLGGTEGRVPDAVGQVIGLAEALPPWFGFIAALALLAPSLMVVALATTIPTVVAWAATGQAAWGIDKRFTRLRRLADYYAGLLTSRGTAKEVRLYGFGGYALQRWSALYWQARNGQRRQALRQGTGLRAAGTASMALPLAALWFVARHGFHDATAGTFTVVFASMEGIFGGAFAVSSALRSLGEHSGFAAEYLAFFRAAVADDPATATRPAPAPPVRKTPRPPVDSASRAPAGACAAPLPAEPPTAPLPPDDRHAPPAAAHGASRPASSHDVTSTTPRPVPPASPDLSLRDVAFTYPGSPAPALTGVTLTLGAGEKVALVGENGAGKTTLAKLLLGLYKPDTGRISIGGADVRQADPRLFSAVFQQFVRYQLTLRENLALGAIEHLHANARLHEALRRVDGAALLDALPDGLESLLGPEVGGTDLSGGQWQRLAVARALLRDPRVLVLDEPTAALDPLAELEVFRQFASLAEGRTAVMVSHRLGICRLADRVIVLHEGRVVEDGPHDDLMTAAGRYAEMFEAQARWYR